ncbi:GH36 C-terminal domain-containing protein [Megamonas hypermegale]|nr:GH36 C-terminal domain-containing protein [Megamonas hypermegale]MDM8144065.1 GH36 C-terminal domain-containing protein [Megamonas hypermegale]
MESPFERNTVSWCFVSEDETKIVCCYYQILAEPIYTNPVLKLKGLKENALYRLNGQDKIFSGSELMYAGLTVPKIEGDFYSEIYILQRI